MRNLLTFAAASLFVAAPLFADGTTIKDEFATLEAHAKARPQQKSDFPAWIEKAKQMHLDFVSHWDGKAQGEENWWLVQAHLGLAQLERDKVADHIKKAREGCSATLTAKPDHAEAKDLLPKLDEAMGQIEKQASAESNRNALVGKPAPAIDADEVLDGKVFKLEDLKGKVVLLDFWATWCPPCRAVIPHLVELRKKHAEAGLEVVGLTRFYGNGFVPEAGSPQKGESKKGLSEDQEREVNRLCAKALGMEYPIVFSKKAGETYMVTGIPQLVVIDRKGVVRKIQVGAGDHAELDKLIEQCLAEK